MDPNLQITLSARKRRSKLSKPLASAAAEQPSNAGRPRKAAADMAQSSSFYISAKRLRAIGHLLSVTAERPLSSHEQADAVAQAAYIAGKLDDRGLDRLSPSGNPLKRYKITWADGSIRYESGQAAAAEALGVKQSSLAVMMSKGGGLYTRQAMHDGSPSVISCQVDDEG